MNVYDVYSYGMISTSTLYLLKDHYPAKSGYAEIHKKYKNIGGEAANTALVLARLGIRVKLAGNWINPDEDAVFLQDVFNTHRVDISQISFQSCRGPKELLVVDSDSRTIFGTYSQLPKEKSWNLPRKTDIHNSNVICLDPFFGEASLLAAHYAIRLGKPIVTVDCRFDDPIFLAANVAIISEEYLKRTYPNQKSETSLHKYKESSNGIVIFTFGNREIIFASGGKNYQNFSPYKINPVDTTGAGDSFRAGIIYGILNNWPIEKGIKFAAALAAMVCQSIPGVLNSPNYDEVISFMHSNDEARSNKQT